MDSKQIKTVYCGFENPDNKKITKKQKDKFLKMMQKNNPNVKYIWTDDPPKLTLIP